MSILLNFQFSGKEATRKTETFFAFLQRTPIYIYKDVNGGFSMILR